MKKLITLALTFLGIITITSCSNIETYSLKEAGGFEISNIAQIQASSSVYQSFAWRVSEEAYQYFDCQYIKVDFDINNEFLSSDTVSELKDDAYVLHVDIKDVDIYADFGLVFFISHNTKYMYFDGVDGTYRSKDTMPSAFIGLINSKLVPPTGQFKLTIIDEHDYIYDKPEQQYFTPFTEIKLHSYPIMDADLVMYVDGEFYSKQKDIETDKGYIWEYTFTMPIDEATLEFKAEGGI